MHKHFKKEHFQKKIIVQSHSDSPSESDVKNILDVECSRCSRWHSRC